MEELEDMEEDAGLGNGGLGRLAGPDSLCVSVLVRTSVSWNEKLPEQVVYALC